jgi:hypothetical protein
VTIVAALVRSLARLASGRVRFLRRDVGHTLTMEDGEQFTVFRHVRVKAPGAPAAVFVVRFTPARMSVRQNIRFSLLPMIPLLGLHGFREKYWCVNEQTGVCQGLYAWQTVADAETYAGSVALRFMARRSLPGSVSHQILDQAQEGYWVFRDQNWPRAARARGNHLSVQPNRSRPPFTQTGTALETRRERGGGKR